MMDRIDLSLRDIHRAVDVNRWQIVKTIRPQSLAEHSFMVAMITVKLCKVMGSTPEVETEALRYALTHDLAEVMTGDIATPVKALLGSEAMSALNEFEERLFWLPDYPLSSANVSANARWIVKVADMIEAVAFLHLNAASEHGQNVRMKIERKIETWPEAVGVLREILMAPMATMDSVAF